MGLIVLFITAPIWIPAVIILLVLGLKVDEWFNHQPPHQRRMYCYDEIDARDIDEDCYDEYVDDFSHSYIDEKNIMNLVLLIVVYTGGFLMVMAKYSSLIMKI